jgi:hypothetical protein
MMIPQTSSSADPVSFLPCPQTPKENQDHLFTQQLVRLQVRQHFDHPRVPALVKLPNHVGPDVGGRRQDTEKLTSCV